jgi:cytochrome c553
LAAILLLAPGREAGAAEPTPTQRFEVPAWAFPGVFLPKGTPREYDDSIPLHVPGSSASFTANATHDLFNPLDWFPEDHPPMPDPVARGRPPETYACAHCHLPDGTGRPENAALAGLPAQYIRAQVADMRNGARRRALTAPGAPRSTMQQVADSATDDEVAAAADYYSRLPMRRRVEIVENDRVPTFRETRFVYLLVDDTADQPLGMRLIEVPLDAERHTRHDPYVRYRAYVPPGSVARGRELVESGGDGKTIACAACHGEGLRGGAAAPPLAGRSPSYQLRQLLAFRAGTRASAAGMAMWPVVAMLDVEDMIAVAAYAATLEP